MFDEDMVFHSSSRRHSGSPIDSGPIDGSHVFAVILVLGRAATSTNIGLDQALGV